MVGPQDPLRCHIPAVGLTKHPGYYPIGHQRRRLPAPWLQWRIEMGKLRPEARLSYLPFLEIGSVLATHDRLLVARTSPRPGCCHNPERLIRQWYTVMIGYTGGAFDCEETSGSGRCGGDSAHAMSPETVA